MKVAEAPSILTAQVSFASRTRPGITYRAGIDRDGVAWCECPGAFYRGHCVHIELLVPPMTTERGRGSEGVN